MMIDNGSIDALKATIDIVDVIGNYVELKKAGSSFKANCPFHGEKTPSFVVSPTKQFYHCFGCGVGGDAIKFVMEIEKFTYPEAIEKLASMYNFSLQYTQGSSDYSDAKRVLEIIQKWYRSNLTQNQTATAYLHDRGIAASSIEAFGIGFVPEAGRAMRFLQSQGLPMPKVEEAGIIATGERGEYYTRLHQRITFPIYSPAGALVGFGGRTITNHPAKYINSPQTKLFNKSRLLYGYHRAKEDIYKKKELIVCEGYLDVIMFHQAGFTTAVATLGTALTAEHLPLLHKGEPQVILAYDGDKAGIAAALKAARLLSAHSFDGGVVLFPGGQDPADLIAAGEVEKVDELLRGAKPLIPFVLEQIAGMYDLVNPIQKEAAFGEMRGFLATLTPLMQETFVPMAATQLRISPGLFGQHRDNSTVRQRFEQKQVEEDPEWQSILRTLIEHPRLIDEVMDVIGLDMVGVYREAMEALMRGETEHPAVLHLSMNDRIPTLSEAELRQALLKQLERYYQQKFQQMMRDPGISYEKKSYLRNKIQKDIIPKLKRGELIPYASDFTI
jgi:DNA primase